jgi:hypothetical protein
VVSVLAPLRWIKRRVEGVVRGIVVHTSFPPFSWAYALYYKLVLRISVAVLSSIPEVTSIYLTGGLSRNRITYGRSDIDLMIFVRNGGQRAVHRCCRALRYLFAIIPADEVGIYDCSDMDKLLGQDIHLAFRLIHAPVPAKLLYGPSLTAAYHSSQPEHSAAQALIGRYEFLWNILTHRLIHLPPINEGDKAYLYAKLSRQFLEELPRGRRHEAISHSASSNPAVVYRIGSESLFEIGKYCAQSLPLLVQPSPRIHLNDLNLAMGPQVRDLLDQFTGWLLKTHAECIESVLIAPAYVLPVIERELSLYLVQKRPLELQDLRAILLRAEAMGMRNRIDLNLLNQDISLCIDLQDLSRSVATPLTRPATFLYLASPECVLHGTPLEPRPPVCDLRAIARGKWHDLHACIADMPLTRLTPLALQELIWQALQAVSIMNLDRFPLTSAQTCRLWQEQAGCEWLASLHDDFPADLDGRPSRSERFTQHGVALFRKLVEDSYDDG